ncbi:TMEM175 family protein [Halomicrococcus gelatinilyticus]|uniref:TMEM175 family protein n=1 Tax=Halomicrococcus gelatinilyticus TaxID=1702103 RepID=UPI002E15E5B6
MVDRGQIEVTVRRTATGMSKGVERESAETGRLIALSDGVFAIVITLLVLEITVPTLPPGASTSDLPSLVVEQWQEFFGYVLSFLVIGLYWILHRRVFAYVDRHDRPLLWLNLLFLLVVGFLPYATAMFSTYPGRFGVMFYAGAQALTGFVLATTWAYAARKDLVAEGLTSRLVGIQAARFVASPLVFLLSMGVALADPLLAIATWVLLVPVTAFFETRTTAEIERIRQR